MLFVVLTALLTFKTSVKFLNFDVSPYSFPVVTERYTAIPTLGETKVLLEEGREVVLPPAISLNACSDACLSICSTDSNAYIVLFSREGKVRLAKLELLYPCFNPPVIIGQKAYTVDMNGNFCEWKPKFVRESYILRKTGFPATEPERCVNVGEEQFLYPSAQLVKLKGRKIFFAYAKEIFEFSDGSVYPIVSEENYIVWFEVEGDRIYVATTRQIAVFKDGERIRAVRLGSVEGAVSGKKHIYVSAGGRLIKFDKEKLGAVWSANFKGVARISAPALFDERTVAVVVEFGHLVRRVFGDWKTSLVLLEDRGGKVKVKASFKLPSFANFLFSFQNRIFAVGERGEFVAVESVR